MNARCCTVTRLPIVLLALPALLGGLSLPEVSSGATLESAYLAALPQDGYTKFVELSANMTYTGGLTITSADTVCIRGNGAVVDLQGSTILVDTKTARLDIDHCVLINGGNPDYGTGQATLNFVGSSGSVINNTIYGNTVGVRVYSSGMYAVMVKNNVIVNNTFAGVLCQIGSEPSAVFNDTWGNAGYGDYAMDCG